MLNFLDAQLPVPCLIAIDAPLSVPNLTGSRPAEAELAAVFARFQAGAHPANRTLLGRYNGGVLRGEWLRVALAERGVVDDPHHLADPQARAMLEVYPHAAMVALFGLKRTLKYKQKGQGREALDAAWAEYHRHLASPGASRAAADWADDAAGRRSVCPQGPGAQNHEDEADAVMCAYVALYAHRFPERCEVFGSVAGGYILTPTLPQRWKRV